MRTYLFLISALVGLLAGPPLHAADDIDFSRAVVVNSPSDLTSWPVTAHLTSVEFRTDGWIVEFDRRLGVNAWPNVTSPGWDDSLQYTLGMCLKTGGYWTCSAVVEFWQHRLEEEGAKAGARPTEIAKDWFYDARWGELYGRQPAPGEQVAIFVSAGDGRNTGVAFPGTVKQRTDVRLISWGQSHAFDASGPIVTPPPPIVTPPVTGDVDALVVELNALRTEVLVLRQRLDSQELVDANLRAQINAVVDGQKRVDDYLASKPIPATCKASVFGIPVSCSVQ